MTYKILRKSVQWEPSCSLPKDGQAGMMKLIVAFPNFANAHKNMAVNLLTSRKSTKFFKNDRARRNWWKA
jgi:hypothetical protein